MSWFVLIYAVLWLIIRPSLGRNSGSNGNLRGPSSPRTGPTGELCSFQMTHADPDHSDFDGKCAECVAQAFMDGGNCYEDTWILGTGCSCKDHSMKGCKCRRTLSNSGMMHVFIIPVCCGLVLFLLHYCLQNPGCLLHGKEKRYKKWQKQRLNIRRQEKDKFEREKAQALKQGGSSVTTKQQKNKNKREQNTQRVSESSFSDDSSSDNSSSSFGSSSSDFDD